MNATLEERISIGMIVKSGEEIFFKYSKEKLTALKLLLHPSRYDSLKSYLFHLELDINKSDENELFYEELSTSKQWINRDYISYLSRYSNNLVQFSAPKSIDIEFNDNNLRWLFEKYVHKFSDTDIRSNAEIDTRRRNFKLQSYLSENLYPVIENNVNIDMTIDNDNLDNLFSPIRVNFIGINNVPIAGKTFDFEKTHNFLENDINKFVSLTKALEIENDKKGTYYVLGKEPHKSNKKSHLLWQHIRESNFLQFVDIQDVGIIEKYVKSHDVRPYFSNEML